MTNPIDIIANAIHDGDCGCGSPGHRSRVAARSVAEALTQDAVIINAGRALAADTASRPDSLLHAANMTVAEYEHLARVVLRSVGGA